MHKTQTLAKRATQAAEFRGHRLTSWQWTTHNATRQTGTAVCQDCHKQAFVDSAPAPNSIDISGEAVALNCPSPKT
jgi:hypothetical protein